MLDLKGINVFQKILLFGLDFGFKDAGIKRFMAHSNCMKYLKF